MNDTALPPVPVHDLMTSTEVAALLRVHKNWLAEARCHRTRNQPPYIRVGGLIRYRREAVLAWMRANEEYAQVAA